MINWLRRWFKADEGAAPRPREPLARPAAVAVAAALPAAVPAAVPTAVPNLSLLFYQWIAGDPVEPVPAATERRMLDELARLIEAPGDGAALVPRVPEVIPQLLKSLRDDSMSGAELSRQLAQDVVLVAAVIGEANSPYYSPSAPLRTIESAAMLLGTNGMRMLLARVAFRPIINANSGRFAQYGAPLVWRQSELCALAASALAPAVGVNRFEAYLAGLLHNIGLVVALRLFDRVYSGAALPPSAQFYAELRADARCLSARIATQWDFPPGVASAILAAGDAANDDTAMAQVLASAERLAMLCVLFDAGQLDPASVDAFIASVAPTAIERTVLERLLADQQKRRA